MRSYRSDTAALTNVLMVLMLQRIEVTTRDEIVRYIETVVICGFWKSLLATFQAAKHGLGVWTASSHCLQKLCCHLFPSSRLRTLISIPLTSHALRSASAAAAKRDRSEIYRSRTLNNIRSATGKNQTHATCMQLLAATCTSSIYNPSSFRYSFARDTFPVPPLLQEDD